MSMKLQPMALVIDERIRLRKFDFSDVETLHPMYQDGKILQELGSEPNDREPYDLEKVQNMFRFLEKSGECYVIEVCDNETYKPIGDVTLSPDIMPIVISSDYWGRGIGKKVILALLSRAKSLNWKKICLKGVSKSNRRSQNLFQSCGFKKIGESDREFFYEKLLF